MQCIVVVQRFNVCGVESLWWKRVALVRHGIRVVMVMKFTVYNTVVLVKKTIVYGQSGHVETFSRMSKF